MLPFHDAPYRFFPPRPNALVAALARLVNRRISLPCRQHRIASLEVGGGEALHAIARRTDARLLFVPNHPTHSDPQIMTESLRRCGVKSAFMAAYDVFLRGRLQAWVMQRTGSFSVDRDASDSQALKTAIAVLAEGARALTIFPEGNVHLANDRPAPFLEGAAFIALRAQKQLGDAAEVFAVPVAIKATYLEDVRPAAVDQLQRIAADLGTGFDPAAPSVGETRRIGIAAIERSLKQRGYPPPDPGEDLGDHVRRCVELLLVRLEAKIEQPPKVGADLIERARRARAAVHAVRADPARKIDHPAAAIWADEAMLALRLLGYAGNYLAEHPTLDRFAETAERIAEDLYSQPCRPCGKRHAFVEIQKPISIKTALADAAKARGAAKQLTRDIEAAVQAGLEAINAGNPHAGGKAL
ncbi:MAG: lysophospholipid acyltransferase family protein [Verrucomicrobiales bacterium]